MLGITNRKICTHVYVRSAPPECIDLLVMCTVQYQIRSVVCNVYTIFDYVYGGESGTMHCSCYFSFSALLYSLSTYILCFQVIICQWLLPFFYFWLEKCCFFQLKNGKESKTSIQYMQFIYVKTKAITVHNRLCVVINWKRCHVYEMLLNSIKSYKQHHVF